MSRLLTVVALLAAAVSLHAADYAVTPDHQMVFVSGKDGGIEALTLDFGRIMWTNKAVGRVAGASNKVALAWAGDAKKSNAFRIVALDAKFGKVAFTSDPIEMPEWATTEKGDKSTFAVQARDDGDLIVVAWDASADGKKDAAVVWVKTDSGKVTPLKGKTKADFFKPAEKPGEFGAYALTVESPDKAPKLVVKKDGKQVWFREIAGP